MMWNMKTVQVVPIVVGSLGSVTKNLDKWLGKLNVKNSISLQQKLGYWVRGNPSMREILVLYLIYRFSQA